MKPIIAIIATAGIFSGCGLVSSGASRAEVIAACSFDDVVIDGDDYIALATMGRDHGMHKEEVVAELFDACVASVEHAAAVRQEVTDSAQVRHACHNCVMTVMNHICMGLPPSCSLQH